MIQDNMNREAIVQQAVDGDTILATVKVLKSGQRSVNLDWQIRLTICDTPERGKPGYQAAKDFTAQFTGQPVQLHIVRFETYGRILADVYVMYQDKQESLSSILLREGLAEYYH